MAMVHCWTEQKSESWRGFPCQQPAVSCLSKHLGHQYSWPQGVPLSAMVCRAAFTTCCGQLSFLRENCSVLNEDGNLQEGDPGPPASSNTATEFWSSPYNRYGHCCPTGLFLALCETWRTFPDYSCLLCFVLFAMGSHHVALAGLELEMQTKSASKLQRTSCQVLVLKARTTPLASYSQLLMQIE